MQYAAKLDLPSLYLFVKRDCNSAHNLSKHCLGILYVLNRHVENENLANTADKSFLVLIDDFIGFDYRIACGFGHITIFKEPDKCIASYP